MPGDSRINRGGRPKGLTAFREHVQRKAEGPALNALTALLESTNEMVRIRAAEVLLAYARGKPGQIIESEIEDPVAAAAASEAVQQGLMEKLKRMEATFKREPALSSDGSAPNNS